MFDFRWLRGNKGQGMVEYILIVVVVIGIVLIGYKTFGGKVKQAFIEGGNKIGNEATTAYSATT